MLPINNISFTDPYAADQAEIQRRRALAQALQGQSMSPIEEQRGGRFVVPISPLQGLAKLAQAYAGGEMQRKSYEQEKQLYGTAQSDYQKMLAQGIRQLTGSPGQTIQPDPQEAQQTADFGTPPVGPTNIPAQSPNPMGALQTFGSNPMGQQFLPLAIQEMQRQRYMQMIHPGQQPQPGAPQPQQTPIPAPQGQPQAGMSPTTSQMAFGSPEFASEPQQPQQPQPTQQGQHNVMGSPVEGIPPEAFFAGGDPNQGYQNYLKALIDARKPISTRYGIFAPGPDGKYQPVGGALPAGAVPYQFGPQGEVSAGLLPGQARATGEMEAAKEAGRAPYTIHNVQTAPAPRIMTTQQIIEQATGGPMPVPGAPQGQPQGQGQGGSVMLPRRGGMPGMILQDQGAAAEQRKYGEQVADYAGKIQSDAANAAVANRYLDNMQLAAKDIRLGKLAPAQSSLTQWAQAAGIPVSKSDMQQAGSIQALTSMAIKMAGTATRQSDAQPSQLQYFKILESMPNEQRTADGFEKIVAYLRDANNYSIAKQQHLQQWRNSHQGSADGFEAAWPKMAEQIPFVWNQQTSAAPKVQANPQEILDELRRRGIPLK